ncbi:hypothetical protein OL233_06380 [Vagococcus sp. PNs007]|uniref:Uncharacterized protein n=1 Tax=Vagococcus proximus TaxID=2991417 RepID=A0ABT5X1Q1_9ENTE|nr:hypothetical protein [Vagococcus proximus]MDF0479916.1 hypothetical protein [Vagococcus proximus]
MKKESSFSKEYDELFEKITLNLFVTLQMKVYFLVGSVLLIGLFLFQSFYLPAQINNTISDFNKIMEEGNKELDRLDEELPYKEILPLRELGLKPIFKLNNTDAEPYQITVSKEKITFGNDYILTINSPNYTLDKDFSKGLKITPIERVSYKHRVPSSDVLSSYKFDVLNYIVNYDTKSEKLTYFTDTAYDSQVYTNIFISENIIDNLSIQVNKDEGAFYKVFPMKNIGNVQTGFIINAEPSDTSVDENNNSIPRTYVGLDKYWIFPDGMGIYVRQQQDFYGDLRSDDKQKSSMENNLEEINIFIQLFDDKRSMYTWLNDTFKLELK